MSGWVKLHRRGSHTTWPPTVIATFMYLLCRARWQDHRTMISVPGCADPQVIERGQVATSGGAIADHYGVHRKDVGRALRFLEKSGVIEKKKLSQWRTLFTIVNYSEYQDVPQEGTQKGTQKGAQEGTRKGSRQVTREGSRRGTPPKKEERSKKKEVRDTRARGASPLHAPTDGNHVVSRIKAKNADVSITVADLDTFAEAVPEVDVLKTVKDIAAWSLSGKCKWVGERGVYLGVLNWLRRCRENGENLVQAHSKNQTSGYYESGEPIHRMPDGTQLRPGVYWDMSRNESKYIPNQKSTATTWTHYANYCYDFDTLPNDWQAHAIRESELKNNPTVKATVS